jgi:CRP-like cAMP-binding protein
MPQYRHQSKKNRLNLIKAFELKEYSAGVTLIQEGAPNSYALFVMQGELRLIKKSKIAENSDPTKKKIPTKKGAEDFRKRLDEKETSTYLLGIRGANTWVGEEILFFKEN